MTRITEQTTRKWAPPSPQRTALELLGFASPLYARATEALAPTGLSYRQYRLLETLRGPRHAHTPHGQSATAMRRGPRADELLDDLEAQGLVRRVPVGDRGGAGVEITPLGSARADAAASRLSALVSDFGARLGMPETLGLSLLLARAGLSQG